ncbi:MAG: hypothetical protein JEZ06_24730 [Anaerolineaceae bacterium]|nr:hypothetical protein [Anaerolineaceae bacterium]
MRIITKMVTEIAPLTLSAISNQTSQEVMEETTTNIFMVATTGISKVTENITDSSLAANTPCKEIPEINCLAGASL